MKAILQAVTAECLYETLRQWSHAASDRKNDTLRILTAFASGAAIEAVEPVFDAFLANGNRIDMIVGTDLGGTDKEALRRLLAFRQAYHEQAAVRIWDAPQGGSIFHPKLYLYESGRKLSAVIGSANLTLGGLGGNLESLIQIDDIGKQTRDATELLKIWSVFDKPTAPLKKSFLRELTPELFNELSERLPRRSFEDSASSGASRQRLWKPRSLIRAPSGGKKRSKRRIDLSAVAYLLMDILDETRRTQLQPPADVMEQFFDVKGVEPAVLRMRLITATGASEPVDRHVVTSRYMRRIEVPPIRGLERPCAIVFLRFRNTEGYAYSVVTRESEYYPDVDAVLDEIGQVARERRYHIGVRNDDAWELVTRIVRHGE